MPPVIGFLQRVLAGFGPPKTAGPPAKLRDVGVDVPLVSPDAAWEGQTIRASAASPGAVRLFEVPLDRPDGCRLELRFTLACSELAGNVYPELRVAVENMGEAYSKGLQYQIKGPSGPVTCALPFYLKAGQHAERASLLLVFGGSGTGTVTVSDVELWTAPLA